MADVETKVEQKVEEKTTEQTEEQKEVPVQKKFENKWDLIDKIKSSDQQSVVLNIFKVHPEATWKEIKEVYKEFHMKIDKVPNKEGMFNLYFRNHNDAINFIKVSPKPILDKKFLIRINDRINKETSDGWNEMGADGHTSKHETMKYYKNKAKKTFNKKPTEEGEQAETTTEEKATEGLNLPTRTIAPKTEKPAEEGAEGHQPRTRKISNEAKGPKTTGESKRFIGESSKPQFTNQKKTETKTEEKPVEKKTEEDWNTVKDHQKEKKVADDTKRKAEKVQKEKEAKEKKEADVKKVDQTKKETTKKPVSNFTDGWE